MTTAVQRRRGTNTEHASFTGLEGEISVNTTNESVHVHDGSTAGGFELMRADGSNSSVSLGDITGVTAGTGLSGGGTSGTVTLNIDGTVATLAGTQTFTNKTLTSPILNTPDINAGSIDGTAIGASSASTGAFTTLTATGAFTSVGIDDNATSTAITIDSSENVGIGNSSPSTRLTVGDGASSEAIKVNAGSGWADLRLNSSASNGGSIYWNDGADAGQIFYYHPDNSMRFHTNASERARLDSSGNLLVGKTASGTANTGAELRNGSSNHAVIATSTSETPVVVNRKTNDGSLIYFYKDGSSVGSIGCRAGYIKIGNGDTNLLFNSAANAITPEDATANSDAALDLGRSTSRFKDLYLSGNAYLGDGKDLSWGGTYNNGNPTIAASSNFIAFYPEGTTSGEAARIDASGATLINTTFKSNGGTRLGVFADSGSVAIETRCKTNVSYYAIANYSSSGTYIGGINVSTTATNLATTSDQRLKENIADADDAGSKIDAIQVRKYDWKADGSHQDYGMVAQELREIIPNVIHESPDEEKMLSVDYAGLVPMLIKEIQSLRNRVAQLEE